MKNYRMVCLALGILVWALFPAVSPRASQDESPFTLVQRVGEPHKEYFYMFSTSVGKYTIRHNGFSEVYVGGARAKLFQLKTSPKAWIEWMYIYEYEGDLLLLYRTKDSGYLVRLDQKKTKIKSTHVVPYDFEPPMIREKSVIFSDGTVAPLS